MTTHAGMKPEPFSRPGRSTIAMVMLVCAAACSLDAPPDPRGRIGSPIREVTAAEADELYGRALLTAAGNALAAQHERYSALLDDPAALHDAAAALGETAHGIQSASDGLALLAPATGPTLDWALFEVRCHLGLLPDNLCTQIPDDFTLPAILCFDEQRAAGVDPVFGLPRLDPTLPPKMRLIAELAAAGLERHLGVSVAEAISCADGAPGPLGPLTHPTDGRGDAWFWELLRDDGSITTSAIAGPLAEAQAIAERDRWDLGQAIAENLTLHPILAVRQQASECSAPINALAEPLLTLTGHAQPTLLEMLVAPGADQDAAVASAAAQLIAETDCARNRIEAKAEQDMWDLAVELTRMPSLTAGALEALAVLDPEVDDSAVFGSRGAYGRALHIIDRQDTIASLVRVTLFAAALVSGGAMVAAWVTGGVAVAIGLGGLRLAVLASGVGYTGAVTGAFATVLGVGVALDAGHRLGWAATAATITGSPQARATFLAARRQFVRESVAAAINLVTAGVAIGLPRILGRVARFRAPTVDGVSVLAELPVELGLVDDAVHVTTTHQGYSVGPFHASGESVTDFYRRLAGNPFTSRLIRRLWQAGELNMLGFTDDLVVAQGQHVAGMGLVQRSTSLEDAVSTAAHELVHHSDWTAFSGGASGRNPMGAGEVVALSRIANDSNAGELTRAYLSLRAEMRAARVGALVDWQGGNLRPDYIAMVSATTTEELALAWSVAMGPGYPAINPHVTALLPVLEEAPAWWFLDPTLDEFWTLATTTPSRPPLTFDPAIPFPNDIVPLPLAPRTDYLCGPPNTRGSSPYAGCYGQ